MRFLLFTLILTACSAVWAWPPTYGAEFEFFHSNLTWDIENIDGPEAQQAKAEFVQQIRLACERAGCKVKAIDGKYTTDFLVTLANGWWFKVTHDPGVIEVTTKPSTIAELKQNKNQIDELIFKSARSGGFTVHHDDTTHFNFGTLSAFESDPKKFMRFFVDYHNNSHLALGTLGQDFENAPPLSLLRGEQREALILLADKVNQGEFQTIPQLVKAIQTQIYTRSYKEGWNPLHYQALGIKYLTSEKMKKPITKSIELQALLNLIPFMEFKKDLDQPLEIRAVWSQANIDQFIRVAELIEARVHFLNSKETPIKYFPSERTEISSWQEAKTRFYIYVVESGLSYSRYNALLPKAARGEKLSEFLQEDLSPLKRVRALGHYKDLIFTSEWFRQYSEKLINNNQLHYDPIGSDILQRIARFKANIPRTGRVYRCQGVY